MGGNGQHTFNAVVCTKSQRTRTYAHNKTKQKKIQRKKIYNNIAQQHQQKEPSQKKKQVLFTTLSSNDIRWFIGSSFFFCFAGVCFMILLFAEEALSLRLATTTTHTSSSSPPPPPSALTFAGAYLQLCVCVCVCVCVRLVLCYAGTQEENPSDLQPPCRARRAATAIVRGLMPQPLPSPTPLLPSHHPPVSLPFYWPPPPSQRCRLLSCGGGEGGGSGAG